MTTRPALFASAYHPHLGGVEELVRQLAAEQRRRCMSPTVVTMRWPKTLAAREVHEGTEVLRHVFRVPERSVRHLAGWAALSNLTRRQLVRQLRARETDLVHVQCVSSNARYAMAVAEDLRLPLVVTMQGELTMDAAGIYQRSAQMRRTWRRALDRAVVITACSQYVLDEAEEHYGQPFGQRAVVIPNGVRLADFAAVAPRQIERPYVLGIGRMVRQKGFDLLLGAFELVSPQHPELDLVLAGDGPVRAELEARAASGPVSDRVRFLGSVNRDVAVGLFLSATAFVLPSRHEPQGIVVLEAMAAGTPVVASRVGGVPEMVRDRENGLLFEGGSSESLAGQLQALLDDAELRQVLQGSGLRVAQRHDWSSIAARYLAAYGSASTSPPGNGST